MAAYRAAVFGTERDDKNCAFYLKVGACRHGDDCQKFHVKPTFSQTVLLKNFYLDPCHQYGADNEILYNYNLVSREEIQKHFDNFYEDVFVECEQKYGYIISMNVCENLNDHLTGNVYIKFINEEVADKAVESLNNRWFGGKPIHAELSPVTDFNKAYCVQNKYARCPKGRFCNFLHVKRLSPAIERYLYGKNVEKPWVMLERKFPFNNGSSKNFRIGKSRSCTSTESSRSRKSRSSSSTRNRRGRKRRRSRSSIRRSRRKISRSCSSAESSKRKTSRSCSSAESSKRKTSRSSSSNRNLRRRKRRSRRRASRSCSSIRNSKRRKSRSLSLSSSHG